MSIQNPPEFIARVKRSPDEFLVVHYSCQSLFDDAPGLSPRITSIAVDHFGNGQTFSFSTHAIAEELHIPKAEVHSRFDEVEKALLERFYEFVIQWRGKFWVHWNMRNLTFGFEHLEHRARVLGIPNPPVVPVEHRINLNDLLRAKYGKLYANHPQMANLMDLNGGRPKDFLTGPDETQAFANQEFIAMHQSTIGKVGYFASVIRKMANGTLKTIGPSWSARIDRAYEAKWVKIVGLAGIVATIPLALISIFLGLKS